MYEVSEELVKQGFSINSLDAIIKRNNGDLNINTQEYYTIMIAFDGLDLNIQGREFPVGKETILFMAPHKEVLLSNVKNKEIYVIAFSGEFYEQSSVDSLLLNSTLFFNYDSEVFIAPLLPEKSIIKKFLFERLTKFSDKGETLYISAAHHTVKAFILDAMLFADSQQIVVSSNSDYISYVNRFIVLLQKDFNEYKIVSHYAKALSITSRKLTEMTEQVMGKSAKQIITEKVVSECCKLLKYSGFTISEISYKLGFSNEGNFTHFIKKHTGKNPSEIKISSQNCMDQKV